MASGSDKNFENTYYNLSSEDTLRAFNSNTDGLTAKQVERNREIYGVNKLREEKKKSMIAVFFSQFKDLLVVILIISAVISFVTGNQSSAVVILIVLVLNAVLGTVQFFKAQKSLESLKKLSSPMATVIRDGQLTVIPAEELVAGDIVTLNAGDVVPGDGRIVDCFSLKTNESSLTGESESVEKMSDTLETERAALGDQKNMVFSGSLVTYGRATVVITAVGTGTELGKIAELMNETKERKTPLQVTMDNFSRGLSFGIMLICALVFGLSLYRHMGVTDALLFAVALAVAAIPEALSSIITISLAIGTGRMAKQNAIMKDLNAVEGLGCVSIICSDKTGTLTQNRMTVVYESAIDGNGEELLLASILNNDGKIVENDAGSDNESGNGSDAVSDTRSENKDKNEKATSGITYTGDPTETAYLDHYINVRGRDEFDAMLAKYPRVSEVPFDSDRKLMSTVHMIDGEYVMYTKGAIDVILDRAGNLTPEHRQTITEENRILPENGLRVLGFAKKRLGDRSDITEDDEYDLQYIGLLAEMDPPRKESAKAVKDSIAAGIKPIMITGDHKVTASAIAKKIGIMKDGDLAVTGPELDEMSEEELIEKLPRISVYARVSPDNKIRIVRAWQSQGHICAMTGDGVNDGPALKCADVGIAMGITGTEVAKDSAAMILMDDNFATIIKAVLNGRNIYANIKNAIKFLLSGNAAGIAAVLYCSLLGLPMPFTAVQLLFINLITDSLPALAISMEPLNSALIHDKPRPQGESVLNRPTLLEICWTGLLISIVTVFAFRLGLGADAGVISALGLTGVNFNAVTASTMSFATLCLARLWHGFNCRGRENIFRLGIFSNLYTIGAFLVGALLLHCILLMPFFSSAFGVSQLNPALIMYVWILSFIPTFIIQIVKMIRYRKR